MGHRKGSAAGNRMLQRLVLGVLLALTLALPTVRYALAHAEMLEASPSPGATFRWGRPEVVRLRFSQELESGAIRVINRSFEVVQLEEARVDVDDPTLLVVDLPDLAPGTYSVNWKTVSVDGHALEGAYDFTILPRAPIITMVVAGVVFTLMGVLVVTRRERV